MHHTEKKMRSLLQVRIYQSKRFYLDELDAEQVTDRYEWLKENEHLLYKNRLGQKSLFLNGIDDFNFEGVDDYITLPDEDGWTFGNEDFEIFFHMPIIQKYDSYFYNRWLKRK